MRLLFITEKFPYPLNNGGNIRTFHILKTLGKAFEVTLFSQEPERERDMAVDFVKKVCHDVVIFPRKRRSPIWKAYYLLHSLFSTIPYPLNKNYSKDMECGIVKSFENKGFDAVHFNHIDAAIYLDSIKKVQGQKKPCFIFDTHNILSELLDGMMREHPNLCVSKYIAIQKKKMRKLEYKYFHSVDRCFVCSEHEAEKIRNIEPKTPLAVVPNGVDIDHFRRRKDFPKETEKQRLIFVGAMDYYPNTDGVLFFAEEILPLILQKKPNVEFLVVGNNPSRSIKELESRLPIGVVGHVADVRDYIESGHVFVVPLRSGGGTRLKVLDAMASSIAVVSTSLGAEGIRVKNEENILLADTPEKFAESVLRLLNDASLSEKIRKNGNKLVNKHYSWTTVGKTLLSAYPRQTQPR